VGIPPVRAGKPVLLRNLSGGVAPRYCGFALVGVPMVREGWGCGGFWNELLRGSRFFLCLIRERDGLGIRWRCCCCDVQVGQASNRGSCLLQSFVLFDSAIELLSVLFNFIKMKSYIVAALAAFASTVTAADGVKGAAEGFAKGIQDITTYTKSRY
jgi:hypothetical protein